MTLCVYLLKNKNKIGHLSELPSQDMSLCSLQSPLEAVSFGSHGSQEAYAALLVMWANTNTRSKQGDNPCPEKKQNQNPQTPQRHKTRKKPTETIKGERAYLPIEIVITCISTLKKRDLSLKVFSVRDIESKI